jgi:hypothetical protein
MPKAVGPHRPPHAGPVAGSIRKRSSASIGGLPLYEVALGPDIERGESRGHAKAVFAIGDLATGIVAVGGLARGLIAIGGMALGAISFGGLSVGVLGAIGGLAIGSAALGGAAIGGVAIGGGAAGYYACGGGTAGKYVVGPMRRDPEAVAFFRENAMGMLCGPSLGAELKPRIHPPLRKEQP